MTTLTDTQVITASGGLVELGYSQITSSVTVGTSVTNVTSTLTVVCDGGPILVEFFAPSARCFAGGDNLTFSLFEDGVQKASPWGESVSSNDLQATPVQLQYRLTPSAGSHTYQVKAISSLSSSQQVRAGSGGTGSPAYSPAFLRVSKIVQATQWPAVTTGTIICTSSTRPASPFEGQTIYETDTDFTYTYNGSTWTLTGTLGSGFVTASSTTAQGPASTLTYVHATITVTPGVWIVNSAMSVFNATTSDGAAVGIYNRTTSAIVSGSMGVPRETSTSSSGYAALHSAPTKIIVSSNTDLCPYATRNGGSSLQTINWTGLHSQGVPNGLITAQRLYGG